MYQICVSGAARGQSVGEGRRLAEAAGRAIAENGHSLMTGATVGLPNYAAEAYKAAGGKMSVGISPATSKIEHVVKYRLPTEAYDTIIYTGLNYVGRDSLLITSADAVICVGGRLGTLHEFTIAVETDTPVGFLEGSGGISVEIMDILRAVGQSRNGNVLFDTNPANLLKRLTELLNKERKKYLSLYK